MKNLDKYDYDTKVDKFDYEAKINQDKKDNERRKVTLILIMDYLVKMGYSGAAAYLQTESGFDIDKYSVAANMDLDIILYEFEEFFKMKHKNKTPTFIIKKEVLPQINIKRDNLKKTPKPKLTDKNTKKVENPNEKVVDITSNNPNVKMEIVGQNIYQTNNNYNLNNYGNIPGINKNKPNDKNEKIDKVSFNDQKERYVILFIQCTT